MPEGRALGVALILALHLLLLNFAAGLPLAALWLEWRVGQGSAAAGAALRAAARSSLVLLIAGSAVGGVVLLLAWTPAQLAQVYGQLAYKIHWGAAELAFSLVLLAGLWAWTRWRLEAGPLARGLRGLVWLLASTNLLYHFPPLLAIAARSARGELPEIDHVTPAIFRQLAASGEVVSLAVHFALAALAAAGLSWMGLAVRRAANAAAGDLSPSADAGVLYRHGAGLALAATMGQLPVGLWVLVNLPEHRQGTLLGDEPWATSLFALSVLAALALLHQLGAAASTPWRPVEATEATATEVTPTEPAPTGAAGYWRSLALFVAIVVLMTGVLQSIRGPLAAPP